jgi:hypothetical protein
MICEIENLCERTVTEYMHHKWPRIWSTCHTHFLFFSSFITYHRVYNWSISITPFCSNLRPQILKLIVYLHSKRQPRTNVYVLSDLSYIVEVISQLNKHRVQVVFPSVFCNVYSKFLFLFPMFLARFYSWWNCVLGYIKHIWQDIKGLM